MVSHVWGGLLTSLAIILPSSRKVCFGAFVMVAVKWHIHNFVVASIIFKHCETKFESQNIDLHSDFEIPMTMIH
jgi:hypothetical protein